MVIDEAERKLGLGRQLVQLIEERLMSQGTNVVYVDSRDTSVGFYEKCGFRKVKGMNQIQMIHKRQNS